MEILVENGPYSIMGITSETASLSTQRRLFLSRGFPHCGGMVKSIELTRGKVAWVDDEDYEWLNQWKWCATLSCRHWYAKRQGRSNGKPRTICMHRLIMDAQPGQMIDHRDRNGLHNWRANLRFCTRSQNQENRKKHYGDTSQYKGVCWDKSMNKWRARISLDNKRIHLGRFNDEDEAGCAYNEAATELFGEFARLNMIGENCDR